MNRSFSFSKILLLQFYVDQFTFINNWEIEIKMNNKNTSPPTDCMWYIINEHVKSLMNNVESKFNLAVTIYKTEKPKKETFKNINKSPKYLIYFITDLLDATFDNLHQIVISPDTIHIGTNKFYTECILTKWIRDKIMYPNFCNKFEGREFDCCLCMYVVLFMSGKLKSIQLLDSAHESKRTTYLSIRRRNQLACNQ